MTVSPCRLAEAGPQRGLCQGRAASPRPSAISRADLEASPVWPAQEDSGAAAEPSDDPENAKLAKQVELLTQIAAQLEPAEAWEGADKATASLARVTELSSELSAIS